MFAEMVGKDHRQNPEFFAEVTDPGTLLFWALFATEVYVQELQKHITGVTL